MTASTDEIREYALKSILDLKSLPQRATQKMKVKLAEHVKKLVLTPGKQTQKMCAKCVELLAKKVCDLDSGQRRNRTADGNLKY